VARLIPVVSDLDTHVSGLSAAGNGPGGEVRISQMLVLVEEDGRWWITVQHNASRPVAGTEAGEGPGFSRYFPVWPAILSILSSGAWLTLREPVLNAWQKCGLIAGSGNQAASDAGSGSSTETSLGFQAGDG
jgi:hypothetical protein